MSSVSRAAARVRAISVLPQPGSPSTRRGLPIRTAMKTAIPIERSAMYCCPSKHSRTVSTPSMPVFFATPFRPFLFDGTAVAVINIWPMRFSPASLHRFSCNGTEVDAVRSRNPREFLKADWRAAEPLMHSSLDRANQSRRYANRRALPDPFRAVWKIGGGPSSLERYSIRRFCHGRQARVHQTRSKDLTVRVILNAFIQHLADSLKGPARDLAGHHGRVESAPHIVVCEALSDADPSRWFDVGDDQVRAKRVVVSAGPEEGLRIVGTLQETLAGISPAFFPDHVLELASGLHDRAPSDHRGSTPPASDAPH